MLSNGGELGGRRFFSQDTIGQMTTTLTAGIDRVFEIPTAFSAGFMKDPPTQKGGSSVLRPSLSANRERAGATRSPIPRTTSPSPT